MSGPELLGYVASALVVLSLAMSSVVRLRLVSLLGSTAFTIYGLLIDATPVAVTNGVIVIINIVHLYRLYRRVESFEVIEVAAESEYLTRFLDHHRADIARYWPDWSYTPHPERIRLFVLRNMVPAGLFIASIERDTAIVDIDYAGPRFRDLRNARFLFGPGRNLLTDRGVTRVVSRAESLAHRRFLERFGFVGSDDGYVLELDGSSVGP